MQFDLPKDQSSIIKVIGVGGGGSNAVNHMYRQGIKGVDFVVCNTDNQALDISPVPTKIQLGVSLTEGRGAGSIPEVGKNSAIEDIERIREILGNNTKMVFVTAGMGGGTGTGAAPVIAATAREMGILTVGIVTMPFVFEGRKRREQADIGIEEMRQNVDTLLVINNNRLREMFGNLTLADAFAQADNVLTTGAKGIAEIITVTGSINVDFEDVKTVMTNSGVAIMGSAVAEGEQRAMDAVEKALASPLLNDNHIRGARYVLLNITYGSQEPLMDEIGDITDFIQEESGGTADVIWGHGHDEELGDKINVTIIATGFNMAHPDHGLESEKKVEKRVIQLDDDRPTNLTQTIPEAQTTAGPRVTPDEPAAPAEPYLKQATPAAPEPVAPKPQPAPAPPPVQAQEPPKPAAEAPSAPLSFSFEPPVQPESAPAAKEAEAEEDVPYEGTLDDLPEPYLKTTSEQTQGSIEFDLSSAADEPPARQQAPPPETSSDSKEPYLKSQPREAQPAPRAQAPAPQVSDKPMQTSEDQHKRATDRVMRLKDLGMRLKTPSGISELENEPAYKRRNVALDDTPHSSQSQVSRFTLSEEEGEDGEKQTGLRPNNPFLHDNVD